MFSNRHSAAGANAGFGYQLDRALHWLAQSPAGASIGIETDDDVAVRHPDASLLLEQDKHSIRQAAQPFGDRSKDLWNTLAIWLDAIDSKQIRIESTAFLMVTNKALPEGIAKRISSGTLQVIGFQIGLPPTSASPFIPQAIENTGGLSHDDVPPGLDFCCLFV